MTTKPRAVTQILTGWGTFDELGHSIRALLFGALVERAMPVVKEYHSDLFHDADWIAKNVNGPTAFEWMARASGTNIGESAQIQRSIGAPGGVLYRIDLTCDPRGQWSATFTTLWEA